MSLNLDNLLPHLPAWLLVLFRLTGIFVFAPLFGSRTIPARIRILWAVGLSLCIYPMLAAPGRPAAALMTPLLEGQLSLWGLVPAVGLELAVGTLIGYGASLPVVGMQVAGQIADQQVGLGLAGVFNPQLEEETGILGEFYFLLAMMIFLAVGGHRVMLQTLLGSFERIPLGGFAIDGHVIELLVGLLGAMFDLGLRVAAPLLCLVFLETVAMGFIARTMPQLNILSIGFPLRIIIGIGVLAAAVGVQGRVFAESLEKVLCDMSVLFGP